MLFKCLGLKDPNQGYVKTLKLLFYDPFIKVVRQGIVPYLHYYYATLPMLYLA